MWATRFRVREYLRGSLWILPVVGGGTGLLLAEVSWWLDGTVEVPSAWRYSPSTAETVLTGIVGAMVGLLGFVVTIGVLVIQSATGSLSPRFMRLWYRDRMQKLVLATFVVALTLAFALLRRTGVGRVPDIGVTVAGFLVTVSLVLLILYFDRFTHRLRPVAIGALVARQGCEVLAALPAAASRSDPPSMAGVGAVPGLDAAHHGDGAPTWVVRAGRSGAIQAIDRKGLVRAARRHGGVLVLCHSIGDFVTEDAVLLEAYGATSPPSPRRLRGLVALGRERTIDQDPAFAMRILVDIAIKALSPAVNDPTTAVQLIDHVESMIGAVARGRHTGRQVLADRGRTRVYVPTHTWEQYLRLAVTEIREYGQTSVQVCRRLRALLEELAATVRPECRPAVDAELARLDAAVARAFPDPDMRTYAMRWDRQGVGGPSWRDD